jgi:hypothetical protein
MQIHLLTLQDAIRISQSRSEGLIPNSTAKIGPLSKEASLRAVALGGFDIGSKLPELYAERLSSLRPRSESVALHGLPDNPPFKNTRVVPLSFSLEPFWKEPPRSSEIRFTAKSTLWSPELRDECWIFWDGLDSPFRSMDAGRSDPRATAKADGRLVRPKEVRHRAGSPQESAALRVAVHLRQLPSRR